MNYTKGERQVRDRSVGGLVMAGLFPFAVEVPAGTIAKFANEADALLDTAAPDMVEALKEADRWLERDLAPDHPVMIQIEKALAKAEGGAMKTIFDTIKRMMAQGLTQNEAINQVECITHTKLPEHMIALIRQEVKE